MAEMITPQAGELCWRELATRDVEKAKNFYHGLFGWQLEKSKVSPIDYDEIQLDGKAFGGMMQMDENWGDMPSHWMTYIAVDNCDETVEKIKANGGNICFPAFDAPNVGRIAVVNDPSGATFSVIQFVTA